MSRLDIETRKYEEIRSEIGSGDVFAFGGKGNFSQLIKVATRAVVSHVGIALVADLPEHEGGIDRRVQIVESTSLNGTSGVILRQFSGALQTYEGEVWWLKLKKNYRDLIAKKRKRFEKFLLGQVGKPYDLSGAIQAGVDILDDLGVGRGREDFARFFCSELAIAALEHSKIIDFDINCSEVTPIDLCMFEFYERCVLLKGDPSMRIRGLNTLGPDAMKDWAA